jgi:lipoprotein signal peptidase
MTGEAHSGIAQRWLLAAVSVTVIGTDQAVKWWAWRHVDGSLINSGGYILLGPGVRSWFAGPVSGALSDVIGGVALVAAVRQLVARRRSTCVLLGGGMVIAGWVSNILDRLGLHNWTAPGSARGVVDFIPGGGPGRCNVADLWIVAGALLLAYALARRLIGRPFPPGSAPHTSHPRRALDRVAVLIVLLAVVILAITSALDRGGVYAPGLT